MARKTHPMVASLRAADTGKIVSAREAVRLIRSGDTVATGETAGWIHFVEDVDRPAVELHYARGGTIWMCAGPGRCQRGDALAVVMEDYSVPEA